MATLNASAPSGLKASMSLVQVGDEWVPYIMTVAGGQIDQASFEHEAYHVKQFEENSQLRAFFIASHHHPQDGDLAQLAAYVAQQVEGRVRAEIDAYTHANGFAEEVAVFRALNDSLSVTLRLLEFAIQDHGPHVALQAFESAVLPAAVRLKNDHSYGGRYDFQDFFRKGFRRIRNGKQRAFIFGDLKNSALDAWILKHGAGT
jgi:hypothetical protein